MNRQEKVCIVTGGTSGIGKEITRILADAGAHVIFTCRHRTRGEEVLDELKQDTGNTSLETMKLDLADFSSVRKFANEFLSRGIPLHLLVNNAGTFSKGYQETRDGNETMFQVNHLGHHLLTRLLLAKLQKSSPAGVLVVGSEAHKFAGRFSYHEFTKNKFPPSPWASFKGYARSKLCNHLFALELHARLVGMGITVNVIHPGAVRTNLGHGASGKLEWLVDIVQRIFFKTPESSAKMLVHVATSPEFKNTSGAYFINGSPAKPGRNAEDTKAARQLWDLSNALTEIDGDEV